MPLPLPVVPPAAGGAIVLLAPVEVLGAGAAAFVPAAFVCAALSARGPAAEHAVITNPKTTASPAAVQRFDISAFRGREIDPLPPALAARMREAKETFDYARIVTSGERKPAARASVATYSSAASLVLKTPPGMTLRENATTQVAALAL